MTVRIYHGGDGEKAAIDYALGLGRMLRPPMGFEQPSKKNGRKTVKYLSADEARSVVSLCLSTPVGGKVGTIVIGPLDRADPKSADVLLKTIEDYDPGRVVPVLWAFDLEGVRPTITSRCHAVFTSGGAQALSPEVLADARKAVQAALCVPSNRSGVFCALTGHAGQEGDLLGAMVDAIPLGNPEGLKLWERLRELTMLRNPSWLELLSVTLNLKERA